MSLDARHDDRKYGTVRLKTNTPQITNVSHPRASVSALPGQVEALLRERLDVPVRILEGSGRDTLLRVEVEGKPRVLSLEARPSTSSAQVDALDGATKRRRGTARLLAAPQLTARVRAELRERRINHVDLAGNVFIREPGWYVWLDADRKPPPKGLWEARSLNPFSKKASLVLRALLEHPAKARGIREIAAETRLSIGHASDIARELVRRGYAREEEGKILLGNGVAALRDWVAAYHWRKNRVSSFVVPFEYQELVAGLQSAMDAAGIRFALGMLAGADRIAPHVQHGQVHLYVPEDQAADALGVVQAQLYGERVHSGGNLHVMTPYYGDAVFHGAREVGGTPVVSPIQLFLDLAGFPLRGAEAARMLAMGPLAHQLGLDRRQLQELTRTLE